MTARIVPGAVILIMDHNVITLADGEAGETAFLSWYAVTYSAAFGAGNVALFEVPGRGIAVTLTDDPAFGARWQQRLVGIGTERAAIRTPPVAATFARRPYRDGSFGVTIRAPELEVVADWAGATAPMWIDGEHGGFHAAEDIWSAFIEAPDATLTVNGEQVPGRAFPDDAWVRVTGRPLSSAHGAFSEVRVTPTPVPAA